MKYAQCNYVYYSPPTMFIFVKCDTYYIVILHGYNVMYPLRANGCTH